ncbi:hypothetical protein KJ966_26140 [bacterium]|nr:hypothetical protein [bacterium]
MDQMLPRPVKRIYFFLLLLNLTVLLSGCFFFSSSKENLSVTPGKPSKDLYKIQKIYIQSFTGPNVAETEKLFFETVEEQEIFTFLDRLPNDYHDLTIMRLEVIDSNIWENEEKLLEYESLREVVKSSTDTIKRRNAIISIKVSLYEAESGKLLLRKLYSQPFQQIYIGEESINNLMDQKMEIQRLTKLLIYQLLTDIHERESEPVEMELEIGQGEGFISRYLLNFGEDRIKKGNRFVRSGDYERAKWMWQLVLYKPNKNESLDVYKINRASAYYNLGVVHNKQGKWLEAANMFSLANRLNQKLKYAQAWGNSMQKWLDEHKSASDFVDNLSPSKPEISKGKVQTVQKETIKLEPVKMNDSKKLGLLERNDQLLLKARELWPLEPAFKYGVPQPVQLDKPGVLLEDPELEMEVDDITIPVKDDDAILGDDLIKKVPSQSGQ